ncbi:MAG: hypothetical protein ACOCZ6_03680 [Nanoarchaeota archaeon]
MEQYESSSMQARQDLKVADHMMNVTYKFVDDPKVLLTIIQRLMDAVNNTMATILYYERLYKRIPPFNNTFENMYYLFKARCTRRYQINVEYIKLIEELREILNQHKKSPVEFKRKDKFVICSEDYKMRVISAEKIKNYINKAKLFHTEAERMVNINGRSNV